MFEVILQMTGLLACGVIWRVLKPGGLDYQQTRSVLTSLVYYVMLPALVLSVLWEAQLGQNTLLIALSAAAGVIAGLLLSFLTCRACKSSSAQTGAIILAVAFPNVTYMGLPVMETTFGSWARGVAIQYDLFACTPLLFTLGILIASRLGSGERQRSPFAELLRIPALWAAILAVLLNLTAVPMPSLIKGWLQLLERGVVPLMLFSIGLSLDWQQTRLRELPRLLPILSLRLFVVPLIVLGVTTLLGFTGEWRAAIVMEAAMPSMVLGIVISDRFKLDVSLYASAVTVTTLASLFTLPLWYRWLMSLHG
ncbi:MAG: AEC family transporter [Gammaproteobacteria bacterium]|nr:AEC family transporter [Gammaproteobacteria bacterium]